jgi:hypothetical protein
MPISSEEGLVGGEARYAVDDDWIVRENRAHALAL